MTSHTKILTLVTFILLSASFTTYGQVLNKGSYTLHYDTSKTAIINFTSKSSWPFDSTYTPAILTQDELKMVDSFLLVSVGNWNDSLDKDHKWWVIDLNKQNYRKQLIVATNANGQKEVWVNCFCSVDNDSWKRNIVFVNDGGKCYFNFKINLTVKIQYSFGVNGLG